MTFAEVGTSGAQRFAGRRVARVEDARLLTGRGTYVDDIALPSLLHACFVRSTIAHARIAALDTSAALAAPGVRAVLTAADINHLVKEQWHSSSGSEGPETPRPPLAEDKVRFVGDPVALVIAESRYLAEDAAELVEVDYDPLPPVVDYLTAGESSSLVHEGHGSNLVGQMAGRPAAELEPIFASAPFSFAETIYQNRYVPVPMEARALLVDYSSGRDEMTIYSATQAPHEVRMFCARLLGLPEHKIRVIARDTGGAFGQKIMVQRDEQVLMLAGYVLGVPIKWAEDRRENLMSAGQSRHESGLARMAFDTEGHILATSLDFVQDAGAYPTPWPVSTAAVTGMLYVGPYRVPEATFTAKCYYTNTAGRAAYRGPWQYETVARELLIDIAAREMNIDPMELRRRNLLREDEQPYASAYPFAVFEDIAPLKTFEEALQILDYDAFRKEQDKAREQGRYLGVGLSTYVEPCAPAQGYYATEAATIRIDPSGAVNVYTTGGSAGNSLETTVVQMTADALGVPIQSVRTVQGDTAVSGFGAGTGGSRSGSMTAGAIREAAGPLRERIIKIAASLLEAAEDDIELAGGRATVRGTGAGVGIADIAATAYFQSEKLPEGVPPGLENTARYRPTDSIWVSATHLCTVEVDTVTGRAEILRYIVSEDCGPMINPNVVEGQIAGGTVQGIGGVLFENHVYDEDGNPMTTTFVDYLMPLASEVPTIEYGHIETPSKGAGGYKGVGEGGAIGAPAAVANAVADALAPLGVKVTRLPLAPSNIVELIEEAAQR